MSPFDCKSRRGTKISVILLGSALCFVMMAYFVFGDSNDEQGLRKLRMISIVRTCLKNQLFKFVFIHMHFSCRSISCFVMVPRIRAASTRTIRMQRTIGRRALER